MASLPKTGVQLVAEDLAQFLGALDSAEQRLDAFVRGAERGGASFSSGFGTVVTGALREVGAIAARAMADAGQAVVAFVGDSISVAGDFEAGMNRFGSVTSDAAVEAAGGLDSFRELFLQLGADTQFSAAQAQEAALNLAKGGIEPAAIAGGALADTLTLAAAGELELGAAAEITAKALGVWAKEGVTSAEVANLMAQAANASTVGVEELALGLYNAQGTFQLAGGTFQELTTTMALLAPGFSSAADAGTSLKTFMARLQPSTKPAIKAMAELGLYTRETGSAFYDAQGNFVGMERAADLLQAATKDLTEAQRIQYLQTIFGQDAIRAAGIIATEGGAGFRQMGIDMAAAGTAASQATERQQGFNFAMETMKGSLETLQIVIGSALLPVLSSLINDYVTPGINAFMSFATSIFSAQDPIGALVAKITEFSPAIGAIVGWLSEKIPLAFQALVDVWNGVLQPALSALGSWLNTAIPQALAFVNAHWEEFKAALIAVGVVLAGAAVAGAIVSIIGLLGSLLNPVTLVIGAVALLAAAWTGDWGGIRTIITDFWNTTGQPIFTTLVTWLQTNIPLALQALAGFWTGVLQPALAAVWDFISAYIFPIFETLINVQIAAVNLALTALAGFWTGVLQPAIEAVWGFISGSIVPLFEALVNVKIALLKVALTALAGIWQNVLKPALETVWKFIQDNIMPILGRMVDIVRNQVGTALEWLGTNVIGPLGSALGTLQDAIGDVIGFLNDLAAKLNSIELPDWMTPGSPTPWETGLRGIADALQGEVNPALGDLNAALGKIGKTQEDVIDLSTLLGGDGAGASGHAPLLRTIEENIGGSGEQGRGVRPDAPEPTTPGMSIDPIVDMLRPGGAMVEDIVDPGPAYETINGVVIRSLLDAFAAQEAGAQRYSVAPPNLVSPVASPAQILGGGAAPMSVNNTQTINMPVYTNQSASVVAQSYQVLSALAQ